MRIIKMENETGGCEVFQEPSRIMCSAETNFMTDEDGGASSWICLNHIRKNRKRNGGR